MLAFGFGAGGCRTTGGGPDAGGPVVATDPALAAAADPEVVVDPATAAPSTEALILAFLDQNFAEAAARAPASIEIPPYFQVAANEITPLKLPGEEQFTGATARGNVYLRVDYLQPLVGFAESAVVSVQQVELRGYPVLRRGRTTIRGTAADTVFTIRGKDLEVSGPHTVDQSDVIPQRTLELPAPPR